MAKRYLSVDGKLITLNNKLIELPADCADSVSESLVSSNTDLVNQNKALVEEIETLVENLSTGANITDNILVTSNANDILTANHKKLCILNDSTELTFKVDSELNGSVNEAIETLTQVMPQLSNLSCVTAGNYIYIPVGSIIYKFNTITKTLSTIATSTSASGACALVGNYIYIFPPNNPIHKFNITTETIEEITVSFPNIYRSKCAKFGNNIYIFGGYLGSTYYKTIYKFDTTTETLTTLSATLQYGSSNSCYARSGKYIYIFGGESNANYKTQGKIIQKFDISTEAITTLSATIPASSGLSEACCSEVNGKIYIFGGYSYASYENIIYKFDPTTETLTTLNIRLPTRLSQACCSEVNGKIYIFGGKSASSTYSTAIYMFTPSGMTLDNNNVLIYSHGNNNYSFELISNQATIPVKGVYIGDSNNVAQFAEAYLYDEGDSNWVNVNTEETLVVSETT